MDWIYTIKDILSYGLIGLAFLFALMSYLLLRQQSKREKPDKGLLHATKFFMGFSAFLAFLGVIGQIIQFFYQVPKGGGNYGTGILMGTLAHTSFINGGDGSDLEGEWKVTWYGIDKEGNKVKWKYRDTETDEMKLYPDDIIDVKANGALISCVSRTSRLDNIPYWLEGKISKQNIIVLLYWSPVDLKSGDLLGTVILESINKWGGSQIMKGWWHGYTDTDEDGNPVFSMGEVEWRKLK